VAGFRVHSGWAALVVVSGSSGRLEITVRRRVEMVDSQLRGARQPYHTAEGLELGEAAALLKRFSDSARRLAEQGLRKMLQEVRESDREVRSCAILQASGRVGSSLAATLASHALIHTADGNHFREALRHASERLDLKVVELKEKQLLEQASRTLRVSPAEIGQELTEMGRPLGPPWTQDQKFAALAARLVLASLPG
jgi:hypothetical protein